MVTLLVMLDFPSVLILMMDMGNLVSKTQLRECLFQWSEEATQLAFNASSQIVMNCETQLQVIITK
eukprot:10062396-Ditylum_brightwellii.AAC.1